MKRQSIKTAILIPSLVVLIIGIVVMVMFVGMLSTNTTNDLTGRLINARVNEYTNEFRALCNDVSGALTAVTPIVANFSNPEFTQQVPDPREEVIGILSKAMMSNDKIAALWTCWEPDAFDGRDAEYAGTAFYDATGRFVPYIYGSGNDYAVEALIDYDKPVEGEYYQGAVSSGKPYITDPYYYTFGGKQELIYTITLPITKGGKVIGAVGADIKLDDVVTVMNAGRILDEGYLFTLSPGGLVATHSNKDIMMSHYSSTWLKDYSAQLESVMKDGGSFSVNAFSNVTNTHMTFLGSGVMIGDTGRYWVICGVVPEKTVNASSTTLLWTIIAIGLALIIVVGVTILLIVRHNLRELPVLTATAEALALGDISSAGMDMGAEKTKNEITLLGRAFSKMTAGIRQQADVLAQIAQGDYTMTIPVRSDKDVMNQAIQNMLESTTYTLNQITSASTQVSATSSQIANGAQSLAQGSTEQASAVHQLTVSISQIAEKTKHNADMTGEAEALSKTIKGNAENGSRQMEQLMRAVSEINDASQSISKVIQVIDNIASQTNILALNASVEAARAGQHGKGFAVVAEEVRNLAAKSAESAKDTGRLIANSMEKSSLGLSIANETSASLKDIVEGINRSAEVIARIAQASDEQAEAISQINTGVEQVSQVIQQNSATAEQSAAASEEMNGQASLLKELVSQFVISDAESVQALQGPSGRAARKLPPAQAKRAYDDTGFGKY